VRAFKQQSGRERMSDHEGGPCDDLFLKHRVNNLVLNLNTSDEL